jgi:hypothetical protein
VSVFVVAVIKNIALGVLNVFDCETYRVLSQNRPRGSGPALPSDRPGDLLGIGQALALVMSPCRSSFLKLTMIEVPTSRPDFAMSVHCPTKGYVFQSQRRHVHVLTWSSAYDIPALRL